MRLDWQSVEKVPKVVRVPVPPSTSHFSFLYPRDSRGLSHVSFQNPINRDSLGLSHFNFQTDGNGNAMFPSYLSKLFKKETG